VRTERSFLRRLFTLHLPLLLILAFALGPYVWSLLTAITPEVELDVKGVSYFPEHPTMVNFLHLFGNINFLANMRDSFVVAASTMLVGLGITVTAAYAFSRFRFRGRSYFLIQFLAINMFPVVLLLIPLFMIAKVVGIMDSYLALVVAYSTFTIPFSVWMMTGFFNAIPRELDEAAQIDGCTRFSAMLRVIIPVAKPGIAATGIYVFITAWNEFLYAVMLTSRHVRTIPVALQNMIGEYKIEWGLLNAGGVVSALPVLVLFFFVQKQLIHGMTAGSVKG
jgi:multiple sugar transport system permease protein